MNRFMLKLELVFSSMVIHQFRNIEQKKEKHGKHRKFSWLDFAAFSIVASTAWSLEKRE